MRGNEANSHVDGKRSIVAQHGVEALHERPSESTTLEGITTMEDRIICPAASLHTSPDQHAEDGRDTNEGLDGEEPSQVAWVNPMERQTEQEVQEVRGHHLGRNVG